MTGDEATRDNPFFFTDSYGSRPNEIIVENNPIADASAQSDLDSSEDEVIFSGRRHRSSARVSPQPTARPVVVTVVEDDVQFLLQQPDPDQELADHWKGTISDNDRDQEDVDLAKHWEGAISDNEDRSFIGFSTTSRKARKRLRNKKKRSMRNDDNAVFFDYVRNISRQEDSSDDELENLPDEIFDDDMGLSSKDKDKFRALSTLEIIGKSSDPVDEGSEDSDGSDEAELEELLSHIRRGASFTMLDDSDVSLEGESLVDFDIIDMQRDGPLKKKKKKGRRQLDFGLSDSDLELHLEQTFEKDRNKKKAKKKEREQLRAEGLLGKKSKKNKDAAVGMDGLKVELKKFLQSQSESLDLPPMKKHQRRVVHELANALMLKSQSRGHGSARFPVLYKTGRTPNFNGKHSVKLDKIFAQPRFSRQNGSLAVRERGREREPEIKNTRRRPNMAASYLEGEVVGGSAPEIGVNNKGRAMLEKMGWSTGTALGALNNKGILQPVSQVVKNTRAGLG